MSTPSTSPAKVLVWDTPVRVFHWLLVLCFAGAYLTSESERWRLVHVTLGYTMAGLIGFRVVWGLLGTRYARFSQFVRGPSAVMRYVATLKQSRPEHHMGHNPAGALAIVALLSVAAVVVATGWVVFNDVGGEAFEELHEVAANLMLGIVGVHMAGVLISSWKHRENLIGAMVTGKKTGQPEDGIRSHWRSVAVLILLAVAAFWWQQWQTAPTEGYPGSGGTGAVSMNGAKHDSDHDDD